MFSNSIDYNNKIPEGLHLNYAFNGQILTHPGFYHFVSTRIYVVLKL